MEKSHQFGINLDIVYWVLDILHLKCWQKSLSLQI